MDTEENKTDIKANRRTALLAGIALILLLAAGWIYKIDVDKNKIDNNPTSTGTEQTVPADNTGTDNGNTSSPAIDTLNQEIKNNPTDPNLYAQKSEILYNSGDKAGALSAVNEGLATNPDSEILKSKKDVLEKDYFPSSSEVTPRQ